MITVISLNSAIDQVYRAQEFQLHELNRMELLYRGAGGKSINVAKVLKCLNIPVQVLGFAAGSVHTLIQQDLSAKGIKHQFIEVQGVSRFCTTILTTQQPTELLEFGHVVQATHMYELLKNCEKAAPTTRYFVISGSLPQGLSVTGYEQFLQKLKSLEKPIILDTSNEALKSAYSMQPTVLKPNEHEFQQLVQQPLMTVAQFKEALRNLKNTPDYLIVSLGKDGALLKHRKQLYAAQINNKMNIVNTVGSGDSFLAGFIAGLYEGRSIAQTLTLAMAAGIANAMRVEIAEIDPKLFEKLFPIIDITEEEAE